MSAPRINVAIAGVGNCASSLVQAIAAAKSGRLESSSPGIVSPTIGGYEVGHLQVVSAFDVDRRKVGLDLSEAIVIPPNNATSYEPVPFSGVAIRPGVLADGLEGVLGTLVEPHEATGGADVTQVSDELRANRADVLICYLPTGARKAVQSYAVAAARAGVAFLNATPEPVATEPEFQELFRASNAALLGDDVRSQLGATALHAALVDLCASRAAFVEKSYQLNIGGNMDFLNLSDGERAKNKWKTKRNALEAAGMRSWARFMAGPIGYVPFLQDEKVAYIRLEGRLLLGMPFSIEVRLQVEDSPNSAGVVLEAVRIAKAAMDRGRSGVLQEPCPFLFKNPPVNMTELEARAAFQNYVADLAQG